MAEESQDPVDLFVMLLWQYDRESDFAVERWMALVRDAYHASFKEGLGIRRLVCFVVGLVPFLAIIFTLSVLAVVWMLVVWLVTPKNKT